MTERVQSVTVSFLLLEVTLGHTDASLALDATRDGDELLQHQCKCMFSKLLVTEGTLG